jgi:PIN domain nuclease of toxin-antitoxin system
LKDAIKCAFFWIRVLSSGPQFRRNCLLKAVMKVLSSEDTLREISPLSLSEIAIKHAKGKLKFPGKYVYAAISELRARVLGYTSTHASRLFDVPQHHADPFDRMIIAQALAEEIPIVTSDSQFKLYRDVEVIW